MKLAIWIGISIVLAGIAGWMGKHYFKHGGHEGKDIFSNVGYSDYSIDAGGIRLHVPGGYISKINPNGRDVVLTSQPGNFSNQAFYEEKVRMGKMDFWLQSEAVSKVGSERMRAIMSRYFEEKSFRHFADRPSSLAGQGGRCSEYRISYGGEVTYGTRVGIVCIFGQDGYAGFEGTLLSAADFYHVIETAQPLKGKTD